MSPDDASVPGESPEVNNNGTASDATTRVEDLEVEIVEAQLSPTRRLLELAVRVISSGPRHGEILQDSYVLDATSAEAIGRMISLAEATGIGRVADFRASALLGRRMIVEVDDHGSWRRERPGPKQATTSLPSITSVLRSNTSVVPAMVIALAITLKDVYDAFRKYLLIDDEQVIEAPLAARIAHDFVDAEAIALLIVGPSSSVKTEVASAIGKALKGYPISDLTPRTLVSGWRNATGNTSLLHKLKDNVLTVKDLTTILSGRADERAKVLGQLREILDGAYDQDFGNGEHVSWTGKLSVLAACTPIVDQHHAAIGQLGTRFLYLRTSIADAIAIAEAAMTSGGTSKQARAQAAKVVSDFVAQFMPVDLATIALPDEQRTALAQWATFLAVARAPVIRDAYRRDVIETPVIEGPARAVKQLHVLAAARARLDGRMVIGPVDVALAKRIAWDSIPALRARVLSAVIAQPGITVDQVESKVQRGATTPIRRALEDLHVLGLVERTEGKVHYYRPATALDGIEPVVPTVPEKTR